MGWSGSFSRRLFSGLCRGGPRPLWQPSLQATPSAGNSSDRLPQQLDRAEDRGDHHNHRAGDAHCQNVI